MYYRDVPLFQVQRTVDNVRDALGRHFCASHYLFFWQFVDDLAATFELERADLNVVRASNCQPRISFTGHLKRATSKGLVCGSSLLIQLMSGETMQINDTEVLIDMDGIDRSTEPPMYRARSSQLEKMFALSVSLKIFLGCSLSKKMLGTLPSRHGHADHSSFRLFFKRCAN